MNVEIYNKIIDFLLNVTGSGLLSYRKNVVEDNVLFTNHLVVK